MQNAIFQSERLTLPNGLSTLSLHSRKVLRMNPDGSVPNDNPFAGSRIWSYGLRNSIGFDFDPQTGNLWESENGPECNDEINRIVKLPDGKERLNSQGLDAVGSTPEELSATIKAEIATFAKLVKQIGFKPQ